MPSSTPAGSVTTSADVELVLDLAEGVHARLWLDGGWGVDAALGEQTRTHGDLDLAIDNVHLDAFVAALRSAGFDTVGEDGATPWNFLLAHPSGAVVDLHVVVRDAEGNGVLGPPERGSAYPAASLTGRGRIRDRQVDCIGPEWLVAFRDAYVGDENDRADVRALCERFDIELPAQYR